jgi:ATP-binding cassette subfamily C protein
MVLNNGSIQMFGTRDEVIPVIGGRKPNGSGDGPPILNS